MKTNFNLESNLGYLQSHLNTVIKRHNNYIQVSYKVGSAEKGSPGVRVLLKTVKGQSYVLKVRANLVEGDRAFVYCESVKPTEQLVPRKYRIGSDEVTYIVTFKATTDQSYVGILFFNSDVDYVLRIHEFIINEANDKLETSMKNATTNTTEATESNGIIVIAGPEGPIGLTGDTGLDGPPGPTGPRGLKGDKGDRGDIGLVGPRGIQGEQGPIGLKGNVGATGPVGPEGPAPNFVAVADLDLTQPCSVEGVIVFNLKDCTFYECDGEQFVAVCSVMGPTGPRGEEGCRGYPGERGCPGPQGKQGHRGDPGCRGERGERGEQGPVGRGEKGHCGEKGDPGCMGPRGPKGEPGPANGPPGRRGPRGDVGEKGHRGFSCWDELQIKKEMKVSANFGMNSDGLPLDPFNTDFGNVGPDPTYFSLGFGGCVVIDVGLLFKGYISITRGNENQLTLAKVSVSKSALAWDSPDWIHIGETVDEVTDLAVPFTFRYIKVTDSTELKDIFQQVKPAIEGYTIRNIVLRGDCLRNDQAIEQLMSQVKNLGQGQSQEQTDEIHVSGSLPQMEPVDKSPLVDEFIAVSVSGNSFKMWGTMFYKRDAPVMFKWNVPITIDDHSFPPEGKNINPQSVSGMINGIDNAIEGISEGCRSITGTVNMTDEATMVFKVSTRPRIKINLNFLIHGNFF